MSACSRPSAFFSGTLPGVETAAEREVRIARLEAERNERRGQGTIWPTPDDAGTGVIPLQIGPGRGDLRYSAGFVPTFPTALGLIGHRAVSFARIFQSQPWVAAAVMRMLTWAIRVPLKTYKKGSDDPNDRERVRTGDHPIATMLENPWTGGTSAQLIMNLLGPILVHGNSVTVVNDSSRSSGTILFELTTFTAVSSVLFATILGAIAGLVPAIHAARLDPVAALRYE